MHKISKVKVLLFSLLLIAPTLIQSQPVEPGIKTGLAEANDPIVEMLDSLVTLNNVLRFNSCSQKPCDKSSLEVPAFTDQMYAERIATINTPIPLTFNEEVNKYIDVYAFKKRELTKRVLGLADLYFPMFEEVLDQEGLPIELKYLSIVESALNPIAKSRVGATGIWQFMYNTGKMYQLKVDSYVDERRDPLKATYAACQYFKDMYAIYNDWLLVIAAYNCGAGNVNRAIVRSGGKTNFWDISEYLPKETRGYVPAFIAVTYIMNYAAEHNLTAVVPAFNYFIVDTLKIERKTTLRIIADQVNLPLDVITYLNPVYKKGVIPSTGQPQIVRLPSNKIIAFLNAEDKIFSPQPAAKTPVLAKLKHKIQDSDNEQGAFTYSNKKIKKTHIVKRGETLGGIAGKYDCTVNEIKKLNKLKSTRIAKGQKLNVYAFVRIKEPVKTTVASVENITDSVNSSLSNVADTVNDALANAKDTTAELEEDIAATGQNNASSQNFVYHLVQRGDTLWSIATRYKGATVEQIIELNNLASPHILKTGSKIKVKVAG